MCPASSFPLLRVRDRRKDRLLIIYPASLYYILSALCSEPPFWDASGTARTRVTQVCECTLPIIRYFLEKRFVNKPLASRRLARETRLSGITTYMYKDVDVADQSRRPGNGNVICNIIVDNITIIYIIGAHSR